MMTIKSHTTTTTNIPPSTTTTTSKMTTQTLADDEYELLLRLLDGYQSSVHGKLFLDKLLMCLSPTDKHEMLLKMTEDYEFGGEGSQFHMCKVCHIKDYERGGWGCNTTFHYCEKCEDKEMCQKCVDEGLATSNGTVESYDPKHYALICGDHTSPLVPPQV